MLFSCSRDEEGDFVRVVAGFRRDSFCDQVFQQRLALAVFVRPDFHERLFGMRAGIQATFFFAGTEGCGLGFGFPAASGFADILDCEFHFGFFCSSGSSPLELLTRLRP